MNDKERLAELYMASSKHSNYQVLASNLTTLLSPKELKVMSRWEKERLQYICKHVDFSEKKVLDIGGNTGFFTFESINQGATHVDYYEGNKIHAEFVALASELLNMEQQISIFPTYYSFVQNKKQYDIVLCLNVIHHLGEDFNDESDIKKAKDEMLTCINNMAYITDVMVFQMGFNWCGKKEKCLFEHGTKKEMEDFVKNGTKEFWSITQVGVAEKENILVKYVNVNRKNNVRIDEWGEFLNRPIFIMKSQKK